MLPVNESDWKLFRKRLPEWQERCMEQLAESYAALLAGPGPAAPRGRPPYRQPVSLGVSGVFWMPHRRAA